MGGKEWQLKIWKSVVKVLIKSTDVVPAVSTSPTESLHGWALKNVDELYWLHGGSILHRRPPRDGLTFYYFYGESSVHWDSVILTQVRQVRSTRRNHSKKCDERIWHFSMKGRVLPVTPLLVSGMMRVQSSAKVRQYSQKAFCSPF